MDWLVTWAIGGTAFGFFTLPPGGGVIGLGGGVPRWRGGTATLLGDRPVGREASAGRERRQRLQVLHEGGEGELAARTGEPPQAHVLEMMGGVEGCTAHLDLLALAA